MKYFILVIVHDPKEHSKVIIRLHLTEMSKSRKGQLNRQLLPKKLSELYVTYVILIKFYAKWCRVGIFKRLKRLFLNHLEN